MAKVEHAEQQAMRSIIDWGCGALPQLMQAVQRRHWLEYKPQRALGQMPLCAAPGT
ncbi:MAG: hypothetical protein U0559_01740 [Anaerolineae bacterium]